LPKSTADSQHHQKEKTMTTTTEYSAVAEAAHQFAEACAEADELLREIVAEGRNRAALAELAWFQKHLRWDEAEVRRQVSRMTTVKRLRAIAGTVADREAASKEAETAAKILQTEGAKVREKIEKLQKQLESMERDAHLSTKRVDEQADAVEKLRTMVPQHIRDAVRRAVSTVEGSIGREISDAAIRLNEIEVALDRSKHASEPAHMEAIQRFDRGAVIEGASGGWVKRSLSPEWPAICAEAEAEAVEIREKLERLRIEFAERIAEAESPLNYFA